MRLDSFAFDALMRFLALGPESLAFVAGVGGVRAFVLPFSLAESTQIRRAGVDEWIAAYLGARFDIVSLGVQVVEVGAFVEIF